MARKFSSTEIKETLIRISGWLGRFSGIREVRLSGLFLFLALILLFVARFIFAPVALLRDYRSLAEADSVLALTYHPHLEYPEIIPVLKRKIFAEARMELAARDSFHLVVDLRDSTVSLTIHGVNISRVKASGMDQDPFLVTLPLKTYISLFSHPVEITRQHSTIVKEPIVVRHAPRDTLEAIQNAYQPDTLIQRPAFMELYLATGIRIVFEQETNPHFRDRRVRSAFLFSSSFRNLFRYLSDFFSLRGMKYSPRITVRMEADDIRAIYRALPASPHLVIAF
jgi:hypothetical protein